MVLGQCRPGGLEPSCTLVHDLAYSGDEASVCVLKLLATEYGVDVNVLDKHGRTPMHSAAHEGHTNVVTLLATEYGVDVNPTAKNGATPMHYSAAKGHTNVVTLLAKEYGVDVNVQTKDGGTPMHVAAAKDQTSVVTLLVKEYGADVNVRDKNGLTPKSTAARCGQSHIVALIDRLSTQCAHFRSQCDAKAVLKCTGCRSVSYCSKEHQKADWAAHRHGCKSILKYRETLARQVTSSVKLTKKMKKKGRRK